MSKEQELGLLDKLSMTLYQINDIADEAQRIMLKIGDQYLQEALDRAINEVKHGIEISCESTMDGFLLVELVNNGEAIIKSQRFSLFETFAHSAFTSVDNDARAKAITMLKKTLAFMESHVPDHQ